MKHCFQLSCYTIFNLNLCTNELLKSDYSFILCYNLPVEMKELAKYQLTHLDTSNQCTENFNTQLRYNIESCVSGSDKQPYRTVLLNFMDIFLIRKYLLIEEVFQNVDKFSENTIKLYFRDCGHQLQESEGTCYKNYFFFKKLNFKFEL